METPGVHELHFIDPYVFFGAHAFYLDTAKPSVSVLGNPSVST